MNVTDYTIIAALAGNGGGSPTPTPAASPFDLVFKMSTVTPGLGTVCEALSGLSFDDLYDKLNNGEPALVLAFGLVGPTEWRPYWCNVAASSSGYIVITDAGNGWDGTLVYFDNEGFSVE